MDVKDQIISTLQEFARISKSNKEPFKARAYTNAVNSIIAFEKPITSMDDISSIPKLGNSIKGKIKEIIETGKVANIPNSERADEIDKLMKVHGIGPQKANELYDQGVRLESLSDHSHLLNNVQIKGLRYYKDTLKKIPFKEMEKHEKEIIKTIKDIDPNINVVVAGSYRRKAKQSGDIDVLITHKKNEELPCLFKRIIDRMQCTSYIEDMLSFGEKKAMAICKLKGHKTSRRIDLLWTKKEEFPFAILYFTGSGLFNVKMRNHALSLGFSMNEYGITKHGEKVKHIFKDEKDIFAFLNLKYIEPENRTN